MLPWTGLCHDGPYPPVPAPELLRCTAPTSGGHHRSGRSAINVVAAPSRAFPRVDNSCFQAQAKQPALPMKRRVPDEKVERRSELPTHSLVDARKTGLSRRRGFHFCAPANHTKGLDHSEMPSYYGQWGAQNVSFP